MAATPCSRGPQKARVKGAKEMGSPRQQQIREVRRLGLNLIEAALTVGVARNTMRELIELGRVRAVKVGRRIVVPVAELERFLASGGSERA